MAQLISIIILLWVSYWVFKDAESRGMNGTGWAIFVFLLLIVGLPFYFLSRKPKLEIEEEEMEDKENKEEQK